MAHSSKIFERQPIKVQNLNGFDLSHLISGTAYTGTLTPVLCRMLMPGTKFSLGAAMNVELPPLATQAFGRVDAHIEVFWCPASVLYGGWKQFISNNPETSFTLAQGSNVKYDLPRFNFSVAATLTEYRQKYSANYGVLDYLGFRPYVGASETTLPGNWNLLPLLCYHLIWNSFYRNPQITRTIFAVNPDTNDTGFSHNVSYVHHSYYRSGVLQNTPVFSALADLTFPDGISVFSLRQRNYPNDYYTAGSPDPQMGNPAALNFSVDLQTGDGEFTIAALRAANSLQTFLERAAYSPVYRDIIRANFGVSPGDADFDEPLYLGRLVVPVYQKSVYVTSLDTGNGDSANPFLNGGIDGSYAPVGVKGASGSFTGEGSIVDSFKTTSFGYVMGLFSLVPHAQYSYGIDRHFADLNIGDYPFPVLQSVGMDSVKNYELYATSTNITANSDFSYIPRYSRWKYVDDRVVGELAPSKSLRSFVIQRKFSGAGPQFGTSFCEIPIDALDSLFAVDSQVMTFSCWWEIFWVFKAVMPLAEFCVPTLGEMQDTHEINVKQGGSRL